MDGDHFENVIKRPWFVEDLRDCWKWLATWIGIVMSALPQIYDNWMWMQSHLTVGQLHLIMTLLAAGGVINTVKNKQPKAQPVEVEK